MQIQGPSINVHKAPESTGHAYVFQNGYAVTIKIHYLLGGKKIILTLTPSEAKSLQESLNQIIPLTQKFQD